jgi:lysozyme family protein
MADFNKAIELLKEIEGKYTKHKADKGNYNSQRELVGTNYGIAAPTYERIIGRPPTEADMKNMTYDEARNIYKQQYWDVIKGDEIKDQSVANIFFDGVVNQGKSIRWMQEAAVVKADGKVGPKTIEAINQADPLGLHDAFKEKRKAGYEAYIKANPDQAVFRNGWMNRLEKHKYPGTEQKFDLFDFVKTLNEISSKIEQVQRNLPH